MIWGDLVVVFAREFTAVTGGLTRLPAPCLRLHTFRTHHAPSARRHGS